MELSPLFSDDSRVAEAAKIAQKLRKMTLFYKTTLVTKGNCSFLERGVRAWGSCDLFAVVVMIYV